MCWNINDSTSADPKCTGEFLQTFEAVSTLSERCEFPKLICTVEIDHEAGAGSSPPWEQMFLNQSHDSNELMIVWFYKSWQEGMERNTLGNIHWYHFGLHQRRNHSQTSSFKTNYYKQFFFNSPLGIYFRKLLKVQIQLQKGIIFRDDKGHCLLNL